MSSFKNEDFDDFLDIEELDELDSLDDEDSNSSNNKAKKSKKDKKQTSIIGKVIPIAAVVLIISIIAYATLGNNSSKKDEQAQPTQVQETKKAELQLVNLEQVAWADKMCYYMGESQWKDSLNKMPQHNSEQSPQVIRKEIIDVLTKNVKRLRYRAEEVNKIPDNVHKVAQKEVKNINITDNDKKVTDDIDEKTVAASQQLSFAYNNYADSLEAMSNDLNKIASYDSNGIRDSITRIKGSFETINKQFINEAAEGFNVKNFDNLATVMKASESEYCSNLLISENDISTDEKKDIDDQKLISDFVVYDRCKTFIDNTSKNNNVSEKLKSNIDLCSNVLSNTSVNKDNELFAHGVDTKDSERAIPNIDSGLTQESDSNIDTIDTSISTFSTTSDKIGK